MNVCSFKPILGTHGHSLARHTYCFNMEISDDPWQTHLLPNVWQWRCHYCFNNLGLLRPGIEPRYPACEDRSINWPTRRFSMHWALFDKHTGDFPDHDHFPFMWIGTLPIIKWGGEHNYISYLINEGNPRWSKVRASISCSFPVQQGYTKVRGKPSDLKPRPLKNRVCLPLVWNWEQASKCYANS